ALNLEVADAVGNLATKVAEVTYHFDEYPPLISMDPPRFRIRDRALDPDRCSHAFDPVGPAAINDGDPITNVATFRAVVWERTNEAVNQTVFYLSRVNEASVRHYVR